MNNPIHYQTVLAWSIWNRVTQENIGRQHSTKERAERALAALPDKDQCEVYEHCAFRF